ncbi:MAG TPA: non-oxidative hydroxyarylic acid decarboxylases subunit D [Acetobacteraceae bacterium]|nr:non-oxidative hydroxyarylic acid decarboxylases subunit D [Acetobacteraceae bacterium]
MSQAIEGAPLAVCPRCRSKTIVVQSTSPVAGSWTVFGCATCLYAWRSTEPEENTNPDKYPAVFRLKPEDLPNLPVSPSIPPRRRPSGGG